jgi:hypothetical protein
VATPQRLPIVNADDGVWGDIIRQYLMKEHYNDDTDNSANGSHQTITIRPGTATAGTAPLKFSSGTLLSTPEAGAMEFNNNQLYFTITSGTVRKKIAMFDDISGASGDMYYRDAIGSLTRVGIGSPGQVLGVSDGAPAWQANTPTFATATKTSSYTISTNDTVIFADATSGTVTITLPTAASLPGYRFYVKRIDGSGNNCSVARSGGDTIDGQTSIAITVQYTSLTLVSNGSAWYII